MPLQLGVLDKGGQVVADNLGHTGGVDRDHLRLVEGVGVLEPLEQVVLAAEHRAVLGHGVAGRRRRLAIMTAEGTAEIGGTPLGAVHEWQGTFKAGRHHLRAERLAGMGRVDHQGGAGKVLLFIFFAIDPFLDPFDLFGRGLGYEFYCCFVHSYYNLLIRGTGFIGDPRAESSGFNRCNCLAFNPVIAMVLKR